MLWEILVPTVRNDGRPYRTRHHRVWDARIRRVSCGLTIMSPARGQWVAPDGKLFTERMIPVRVVATRDQIREVVKITMGHYPDQLAILCYKISDEVIMTYRTELD